jgi:hypothetical protein
MNKIRNKINKKDDDDKDPGGSGPSKNLSVSKISSQHFATAIEKSSTKNKNKNNSNNNKKKENLMRFLIFLDLLRSIIVINSILAYKKLFPLKMGI